MRGDRAARIPRSAAAALVLVFAASCATDASSPDSSGDRLSVVASFYPLSEAAARVGGPVVAVTNLTPPGAEPHDLELDPEQVTDIADADLVLYLGEGFQPAVQDAVGAVAEGEHVDLLDIPETRSTSEPGEASVGEVVDPHIWLDPVLMRRIVVRVAETLSRLDPERAVAFQNRAAAFGADLAELDDDYRSGLSSCRLRVLVTSHAAFGYLADRYGLTQEPITGISPEAEPDPARLAQLAADVERTGTTTIFTETLVSPKVAQTLAREAGVVTAVLNPIEGLTAQQAQMGEDYLSVMRSNLAALRRALECA